MSLRGLAILTGVCLLLAGCGKQDPTVKRVQELMNAKSFTEANSVLEESIANNAGNKEYRRLRVKLFLKMGQFAAAEQAYDSLSKISPNDPVLKDSLSDKDPVIRISAVWTLGLKKDADAVTNLIPAVSDQEKKVRMAAITALGDIRDAKAVPVLIHALKDSDWEIRAEAATSLGKIGDGSAAKELFTLMNDPEPYVRDNVMSALVQLVSPDNKEVFRQALKSGDEPTRFMSALALARIKDPEATPVLMDVYPKATPPEQREIIRAFIQLDTPDVLPVLRDSATHGDSIVRAQSILALGRLKDEESQPLLERLAQNTSEPDAVRIAAAVALKQLALAK